MAFTPEQLRSIRFELGRTQGQPAYEAIDAAWLALLKAANGMSMGKEHERMAALIDLLPEDAVRELLLSSSVESLLNLDPPLESILTANHEEIDGPHTARQLGDVSARRQAEPKAALQILVRVLKRVRNRRMHGFKTPDGPRDQEILEPSTAILQQLGAIVLDTITT